jgi:hypothetical protein
VVRVAQRLAAGIGRLAADPGHPAEHEQPDLGRRHPDRPGHHGVGQLVGEQRAADDGQHEDEASARGAAETADDGTGEEQGHQPRREPDRHPEEVADRDLAHGATVGHTLPFFGG